MDISSRCSCWIHSKLLLVLFLSKWYSNIEDINPNLPNLNLVNLCSVGPNIIRDSESRQKLTMVAPIVSIIFQVIHINDYQAQNQNGFQEFDKNDQKNIPLHRAELCLTEEDSNSHNKIARASWFCVLTSKIIHYWWVHKYHLVRSI